jgi:hypothetical protein
MNPLETSQALADPIGFLGGRWMASKATYAYGDRFGFQGRTFYYLGRGGALGDVRPEVVSSAMAFFPYAYVEELWRQGRAIMDPTEALAHFSECNWTWGRQRLATAPELERTAELVAAAIDDIDASLLSLFAGWREAPRPDDPPALASHLMHVLREYRGGCHAVAIQAAGITPLEATIAGRFGVSGAQSIGWDGEMPEITDDIRERRTAAETLTDQLVARAFEPFDDAERDELVARIATLTDAVAASSSAVPG